MVNCSDVLGLLKLVFFESQGLIVHKRSDYFLFSSALVPLGKAGRKRKSVKFWQCTGILPQGDLASPSFKEF